MTHDIQIYSDEAAARRPLRLWALRGMFALCGTMMALVILSDPRASARMQSGIDWVGQRLNPDRATASLDVTPAPVATLRDAVAGSPAVEGLTRATPARPAQAAPSPAQASKPRVLSMPTNRIPVRRANQTSGN